MKQPFTTSLLRAALYITLSLCLSFCSKKSESETSTTLLLNGTWKLSTVEYMNTDGSWLTGAIPSDRTGATISFFADNSYSAFDTHGAVKGVWKFSADFSQLTCTNTTSNVSGTVQISVLTKSTLQLGTAGPIYVPTATKLLTYAGERDTYTH